MAPNKNQSSDWSKRDSGQWRTSSLAGISTARTNTLTLFTPLLFPSSSPSFYTHTRSQTHTHACTHRATVCSMIVLVHISYKRDGFHLTKNQRLCLPAWLLEAHEGSLFTLIKYGLLANWMNANVFKPLNHMLPGDITACRAILLCVPFLITV